MGMRQSRVELPTKATFKMKVNGHATKIELDRDCLDAISRRVYGANGLADERSLGLLIHGFIGQFVDCNEPPDADFKDAAYQLGRKLGAENGRQ